MPRQREGAEIGLAEARDPEAGQDALQIAAVERVELAEWNAAGAHLLHGGLVLAAPGVREGWSVEVVAERA